MQRNVWKFVSACVLVWVVISPVAADDNAAHRGPGGERVPEVAFTQDGPDLIVTAAVTVNNSPHTAWTTSFVKSGAGQVSLRYVIVQNRDLFVRSQKQVELRWRLANSRKEDAKDYRLDGTVMDPASDELRQLLPQLQDLADKGTAFKQHNGRRG